MTDAIRRLRNRLGRARGYSGCHRCGDTWDHTQEHSTKYTKTSAMFPLCEKCWSSLTPLQRLPYYRELWDQWNHAGFWIQYHDGTWHLWPAPEPWPVIERAVLTEDAA